jgi:hypothetical protein
MSLIVSVSTFSLASAAIPSRANGKSHGVTMQLWAYWMSMLWTLGRFPTLPAMRDEALVLDRAGLAAIADPHIALAVVGAEGDEENSRALVGKPPRKLGIFAVVADQDSDRAAVGLDRVDRIAALDVPPIALVGGRMDFLLLVDRSVAKADEGDVLDVAVVGRGGVRSADDVDVVLHRHVGERFADFRSVGGQLLDRLERRQLLFLVRQQLKREHLRKNYEVRPVIGCDIDEIFDVAQNSSKFATARACIWQIASRTVSTPRGIWVSLGWSLST